VHIQPLPFIALSPRTIIYIVPYPKITAAAAAAAATTTTTTTTTTIIIIMCTFRKMRKHQLQEVAVLHQKRLQILLKTRQYIWCRVQTWKPSFGVPSMGRIYVTQLLIRGSGKSTIGPHICGLAAARHV
jgi:hypothetical protein